MDTIERGTIIAIVYTKGGAHKSTNTINMATELARLNNDVVIIDADKQRTISKWHDRRTETAEQRPDLVPVHCIEKLGNIKATALDAAQRYDVVFIDTAGRDSKELRIALMVADLILIPTQTSQFDLEAMEDMADILAETEDLNPDRKVLTFVSGATTNPNSKTIAEAREFIEGFPEVEQLKTRIRYREAYRAIMRDGLAVCEGTDSKAKAEVSVLAKEVQNHV